MWDYDRGGKLIEEEVKWKMKNEKEDKRDWAADSGSGSVLLVEGLHEGRKG